MRCHGGYLANAGPFALFASSDECTAACLPAHAVPALGLPGALGFGLSLGILAVAWLRHSNRTGPRRDQ